MITPEIIGAEPVQTLAGVLLKISYDSQVGPNRVFGIVLGLQRGLRLLHLVPGDREPPFDSHAAAQTRAAAPDGVGIDLGPGRAAGDRFRGGGRGARCGWSLLAV